MMQMLGPAAPARTWHRHLLIASAVAALVTGLCLVRLQLAETQAADFTWVWRGARELLQGDNPYLDPSIGTGHPYPADAPLYYPLPALFVAAPLAFLPAAVAGAIFFGISTGLLVFGLLREPGRVQGQRPWRWALFLALPFWNAFGWAQWSPLITAAVLLPALVPLALAKPSVGLAAFAARPTKRGLAACLVVLAISLIILPSWPWDWRAGLSRHGNFVPLLALPFGPLLGLAALRARTDWRARLLLAMAIVPQNSYDLVPLWLIPEGRNASTSLAVLSWLAYFGTLAAPRLGLQWPVVCIYLPVLGIVLAPQVKRAITTGLRRTAKAPRDERIRPTA